MVASFLIQKLRWIKSSSRVEFFIFLIAWGMFFRWKELDLQLLPPSLLELLLLVSSLPRVCWKQSLSSGTHSSNEWILRSWEAIQNGHHYFCILHFFFPRLRLFFDLRDPYDCMVFAFWIFTFFNWFLKAIFRFMFFPSNSLVKESNIFDVFR